MPDPNLPRFIPTELFRTSSAHQKELETMPSSRKTGKILTMLLDADKPIELRLNLLRQVVEAGVGEGHEAVLNELLEAAAAGRTEDRFHDKTQELVSLIEAIKEGPLRNAIFDRMLTERALGRRAQVILSDGTTASPLVPDDGIAEKMLCGDSVWLDAKGTAVLYSTPSEHVVGEEATLESVLPDGNVGVTLGEMGRAVYRPTARLREQIDSGEAEAGAKLLVCVRRMLAFRALPENRGPSNFRFLCHEPVPDVVLERDLGAPAGFIGSIAQHVRREISDPESARRYRLRRSILQLLSGTPGSGKTLSIQALWNLIYTIVSEQTGVDIRDLPPRVMRLRSSDVLSKWLGSSDKRLRRFFDEVELLAAEPFVTPDGRRFELPVLVIAEEIDALARTRGEDGIHDRIMTTLLEGLDPGRAVFRDRLVIVIATTNTPELVDMAMIRRIGGRIERFGHLGRVQFAAVLAKQIRDLPIRTVNGEGESEAREAVLLDLSAWLYGPNSEVRPVVELTLAGQAEPVRMRHIEFLTAGLVDRSVQEACAEAAAVDFASEGEGGLGRANLAGAIDRQVRHIVDLLTPANCGQYLELPDGERVVRVRRLARPATLPFELERAP